MMMIWEYISLILHRNQHKDQIYKHKTLLKGVGCKKLNQDIYFNKVKKINNNVGIAVDFDQS